MNINREMYWRFQAIGEPAIGHQSRGKFIDGLRAAAEWAAKNTIQKKIIITFATELAGLESASTRMNQTDSDIEAAFASIDLSEMVE